MKVEPRRMGRTYPKSKSGVSMLRSQLRLWPHLPWSQQPACGQVPAHSSLITALVLSRLSAQSLLIYTDPLNSLGTALANAVARCR